MPSGAKRRKAAKKKKEKKAASAVPNGNGEAKVIESDGGENSSPASQDLETQQNPFTNDEDKELCIRSESVDNEKMLNGGGDVLEIVEEAKSENAKDDSIVKGGLNHGGLERLTNGSLSREKSTVDDVDIDGSQVVAVEMQTAENGHSEVVTADPVVEYAKDASRVEDAMHAAPVVEFESNAVVLDQATHEPESVPLQKSAGSAVADLKSKKYEEKVHPSETFSDLKADSPLSGTSSWELSREIFTKQLPQSNILIGSGVSCAGSSDIEQHPEKEPLLPPARGPADKTSWTSCCGLLELFTGSSR